LWPSGRLARRAGTAKNIGAVMADVTSAAIGMVVGIDTTDPASAVVTKDRHAAPNAVNARIAPRAM
jgi:hypothetical protein